MKDWNCSVKNTVFVRLRVPHTIESGFDHSLQLSQIFVPCALFSASIAGVCVQLHIDNLLRDTTGSISGLVDGAFRNWNDSFSIWPLFTLKLRLNSQSHEYSVLCTSPLPPRRVDFFFFASISFSSVHVFLALYNARYAPNWSAPCPYWNIEQQQHTLIILGLTVYVYVPSEAVYEQKYDVVFYVGKKLSTFFDGRGWWWNYVVRWATGWRSCSWTARSSRRSMFVQRHRLHIQ